MELRKVNGKTIGEVEKLTGIPKRKLKYYVERGLIQPARKSDSGYWLYSGEDIERLRLIFLYHELGYADEQIRDLLSAPDARWQAELDRQILRLTEGHRRREDRLLTAEYIRYCSRTGREARGCPAALDEEPDMGSPELILELCPSAARALFRSACQAFAALLKGGGLWDGLEERPLADAGAAQMEEQGKKVCDLFRKAAGSSPEETLFALRLADSLGGVEELMDALLERKGAIHSLSEAVQVYCDRQKESGT